MTDVTETFDGAHLNGSIAPEFSFSKIFDKERNMLKGNNLYREW